MAGIGADLVALLALEHLSGLHRRIQIRCHIHLS
jgi:hypothetical protein